MLCAVCNSQNPDSAGACRACGSPLGAAAPAAALHALPVGTKLQGGAFTVGKVLGQGGFGITYLGSDARGRQPVAIKELFPHGCSRRERAVQPAAAMAPADYESTRRRFLEEACLLARFRHAGIVRVHTAFEENLTAYLVMEFLKGPTLLRLLDQHGPFPEQDALSTIQPIGEALSVLHQAKLLHRDLKPENVIRTEEGRVVLLDFGTAREFAAGKTRRMTAMLTPGYAPLEQYGQQARFGAFTDVYALGALLYHLLTGQVPVQATDRAAGVALASPQRVKGSISRGVSDAVMWAMEMKVDRRPQSVSDFLSVLRGAPRPVPSAGRARGKSAPATPAALMPAPAAPSLRCPHAPRMQQIVAELAKLGAGPSRHDARIREIEATLSTLAQFSPGSSFQCPACRQAALAHVAGHPDGRCPICRQAALASRALDPTLCPVCRGGKLVEQQLNGSLMFCPVCRVMPLRTQRHSAFGATVEATCACPHCQAEFEVVAGGKAKLTQLSQDPHGMRGYQGKTLSIAEWKRLAGRSDRYWLCSACAARFDAPDERRMTLIHCNTDPYGVGRQYRGKSFFRDVWARTAQGLPPASGNRFCPGCRAEFDYDEAGQSLHLLQCDARAYRWAQSWRGKPVPVQRWYLAAAGKRSLRPGWACPACKTEFDSEEAALKLVWTPPGALSPLVNKSLSLSDWHRRAAGLPGTADEKRLRDELARLQSLRQQEQGRLLPDQQRRCASLERELTQLCKQSLLAGHLSLPAGASGLPIRPAEAIRWQSPASRWRLRSAQGASYWDREAEGTLVLTNERLLFAPTQGNLWQHPLKKLRAATLQRLPDTSALITEYHDLQRPIAFAPQNMRLDVNLDARTSAVTLTVEDLAQMLQSVR